ncbi:response regulator transcription factor [Acinetobacter sp. YH16042]|uniref:response regulator transcription factor n=1 Tax=Acinetobacter sp. YH16042 TaxID=2601186 RepID=UPI0015D4679D|nr:response regulator transcription factor [Acinetobacter sp. YH16042]
MMSEFLLPVPVLIIDHQSMTSKTVLFNILGDLGYPEDLITFSENLADAEQQIFNQLPNLIFLVVTQQSDISFIHKIKKIYPSSNLIILVNEQSADLTLHAIQLGATAYMLIQQPIEDTYNQLKTILRGGAALHPSFAKFLLSETFSPQNAAPKQLSLNPVEYQILDMVSHSATQEQMVNELKLSTYQIDGFVKNIYRKICSYS